MTNVRDVFRRPGDGEPVPGVWVQVELVPPGGSLPAEESTIFTTSRIETDPGGEWQFDLPPTVNGDSAYTSGPYVYLVSAAYGGHDLAYHIDVPTSLETVWAQDIRTDPPDPEVPPDPTPGDGSFVAVIDGNDYDVTAVEFTADVDAQIVAAETLQLGVSNTIARVSQLAAHEADQTTHGVDFTQLVDIVALGAAVEEARTIDAQLYEDESGNLSTDVVSVQLLADAVHALNIGEGGGPGAVDDLNDLDDVNLTGLVTGQGITYNGALFVPTDLTTQTDFDAHLADTAGAHAASAIAFTPDGSISATTVQAAIVEVRDEATGGGGPLPDVVDELQIVSDIAEAFETAALITVHDDGVVSGQFASSFMLEEFLLATDAGDGLGAIGGAPAVHTHDAEDLTGFQTLVDSSSIEWTDAGSDTSGAVVAIAGETITSGTVADARIASTIARDSEVAAEAALARNADNLTSGTVADARIASTIARDSEVTSAVSALSSVYQPLDADLTSIAALTTSTYGRSLLTQADAAALRSTAGVVIGTNVQAYDADLTSIAALTTTTFGRSLLTQADADATKDTLDIPTLIEGGKVDLTDNLDGTVTIAVDMSEGIAGDQTWYGGTTNGDDLTIMNNSGGNSGILRLDGGALELVGATVAITGTFGIQCSNPTTFNGTAASGAVSSPPISVYGAKTNDDVTALRYLNYVETTTASATIIASFTAASIANDTVFSIEAVVTARQTAGTGTIGHGACYRRLACFRDIGGTTTQIGATADGGTIEDNAGWDIAFDISTNNVRLRVTGEASKTIMWHADITYRNLSA